MRYELHIVEKDTNTIVKVFDLEETDFNRRVSRELFLYDLHQVLLKIQTKEVQDIS